MQEVNWMRSVASWLNGIAAFKTATKAPGKSRRTAARRKASTSLSLEALEDRAVPSAGGLDTSFNGTGKNTVGFNLGGKGAAADDVSHASALQSNGMIVVAGSASGIVSGTSFSNVSNPPTGATPTGIAVGDFNGDGYADMAVSNFANNNVSILIGNGNGTFLNQATTTAGANPASVAVGNVVGDTNLDLVVTNYNATSSVSILQGNGNGTFGAPSTVLLAASSLPRFAALGDVDGKNGLDIVTCNNNSTLSVLLNNGNGTFAVSNIAFGEVANQVLLAATRGTGQPLDIVTVNQNSDTVSVLLGNNNGTFGAKSSFSPGAGTVPVAVASGDFNGDSKLDLVTANSVTNTFSFLAGNGNGAFAPGTQHGVGGTNPRGIAAADFNRDGKFDVATVNTASSDFSVNLGNGNGTFQAATTFKAQGSFGANRSPTYISVGDFNATDGAPDVAISNQNGPWVSVFSNASASGLFDFAVARFTNSGILDASFGNGGKVTIGFNLGGLREDRAFATVIQSDGKIVVGGYAQTGTNEFDFALTRLNTNGTLDTTFGTSGRVVFGFNLVSNAQDQATSVTIDGSDNIDVAGRAQTGVGFNFAVARVTPAGALDATFNTTGLLNFRILPGTGANNDEVDGIVLDGSGNIVLSGFTELNANDRDFALARVLSTGQLDTSFNSTGTLSIPFNLNVGQQRDDEAVGVTIDQLGRIVVGGFAQVTDISEATFQNQLTAAANADPIDLTLGDFNGDRLLDVAIANESPNHVSVLLGNGNGTYSGPFAFAIGGTRPFGIANGNFNGDSSLDLVTANVGSSNLSILIGNGTGAFALMGTLPVGSPQAVAVGHFDNNSTLDIAVAAGPNILGIFFGNGNGTFQTMQTVFVVGSPVALAVADLNNDGFDDVAVAGFDQSSVSVVLSNGNGTFTAQQAFATQGGPQSVASGDFNRDGNLDLAVACQVGRVSVLLGNGNGLFGPQSTYSTGNNGESVVVGDFNSDGALDLGVGTVVPSASVVQVLLGTNDGKFLSPTSYTVENQPFGLAAGDMTLDGALDLVSVGYYVGTVSTLLQVPSQGDFDFAVARVTSGGLLDTTFGLTNNGKRTVSFNVGGAKDDEANAVIVQPNGSILISGYAQTSPNSRAFALARLDARGFQLDATINSNGKATVSFGPGGFGSDDVGTSMLFEQLTGNIILAGYAQTPSNGFDFAVSKVYAYNWIPIMGDWNGDGVTTEGLFDPTASAFFLKNAFTGGGADIFFQFGPVGIGWLPIVGNWTGTLGGDRVGLWNPVNSQFFLKNTFSGGSADNTFSFGPPSLGFKPLTGDWDNNGTTTVGLFEPKPSVWFLNNANTSGGASITFQFGPPSIDWVPITGSWQGSSSGTEVGLWDRVTSTFYAKFTFTGGGADLTAQFGPPSAGTDPLTGDWNGNGVDTIGLFYPPTAQWFLNDNFSGGSANISFQFGPAGLGGPMLQSGHVTAPEAGAPSLRPDDLTAIVNGALERFAGLGLTTAQLELLRTVEFMIADLPQSVLGYTIGNTVYLSRDGDGYGWFVDATPGDDVEYVDRGMGLPLAALPDGAAAERMDLLTVVMHEMGHSTGWSDVDAGLNAGDLMAEVLLNGTRRIELRDEVFVGGFAPTAEMD